MPSLFALIRESRDTKLQIVDNLQDRDEEQVLDRRSRSYARRGLTPINKMGNFRFVIRYMTVKSIEPAMRLE